MKTLDAIWERINLQCSQISISEDTFQRLDDLLFSTDPKSVRMGVDLLVSLRPTCLAIYLKWDGTYITLKNRKRFQLASVVAEEFMTVICIDAEWSILDEEGACKILWLLSLRNRMFEDLSTEDRNTLIAISKEQLHISGGNFRMGRIRHPPKKS